MSVDQEAAAQAEAVEPMPKAESTGGPPLVVRLAFALAAGLGLALAFPPIDWAWLAPFAVAALTWLCTGVRLRRAGLIGFVFGLGCFGLLEQWLRVAGTDGWLAVVVIQSLFTAALGVGIGLVSRLRAWPLWAATLWVLVELARSHVPFGGFPWGRLAYGLVDTPMAATAWLGGAVFVTFVAALAGNLALWAVLSRRVRTPKRAAALVLAAALALGGAAIPLPTSSERNTTVAVVQGNIPGKGLAPLGEARTVTNNHLAATEELMRGVADGSYPEPDFVLWPENSTDIDPFVDPLTRDTIETAVDAAGMPVLVGAILYGPGDDHRQTTGIVWDPESGPGKTYAKQHPVPFGEYIPMRDLLLPYIDRLQMVGRQTYPGDEPGNLRIAGVNVGLVICFEIAYDEIVRGVDSSELFVVQSNNATFQTTGMPEQQFAITRLRAMEYGKAALVATPSGISGVIASDGTVVQQSEERTREIFVETVPLRTTRTPAAVLGPIPELLLASVGLLAVAVAVRARRRTKQAGSTAGSEPTEVSR